MSRKKGILIFFIVLILGAAILTGGWYYLTFHYPNVVTDNGKTAYLLIPEGTDYQGLIDSLQTGGHLKMEQAFRWAARRENLPDHVHAGRYALKHGMNNRELARKLAMGWQDPLNITLSGSIRTFERLASVLARNLAIDSASVLEHLRNDSLIASFGFDSVSLRGMFIPNTYEVFWTITGEDLLKRMRREYDRFWNEQRKDKAKSIGLTQKQVSTLASIVNEETANADEMPLVAGVYMNRLRIGMPLQADPTLFFAAKDYSIRRVLKKHTKIESPYNTYKYRGLPPGPIAVPTIEAIDAVLHYRHHNYLYFCAKEDFSGYHNFAVTLGDHMKNARRFQRALTLRMNQEGRAQ
ncbi:MAG TPA: endolytic transglycosylase MltG [Bacteroidales bacterium]|nr:endolytic transglycosylase MltG [Bacteroidales bacterium]HOR11514.1 endolytic transglycosylase MltG [Bacteroidales bacterium]HPB77849.1 endolytic transglycosylase MltG [Bacteroidales bacterium]HPK39121.1 endolytic transglycosylase MltG [Bacteroidales bacterium]HQN81613.1 endolytic transglycosylase MltG [Bacteroidales bacterium]